MSMNRLFYGDNLSIMLRMPMHCVDLIYLDPPFKSEQSYNLIYRNLTGRPVPEQAVEAAIRLWNNDKWQFEHWAVERVGGFPTKKTGDRGIDGRIYFETKDQLGVMVLSVKGGHVNPAHIRDLVGVLSVEPDAELAGFITMRPPTRAMKDAAAAAGVWEYRGVSYARVQILTIREILEEKWEFHMPTKVGIKNTKDQLGLGV